VLLDIKYTTDELYRKYVGCSIESPLGFLAYLNEQGIPTTLRQVMIPSLNNNEENITELGRIRNQFPCVDGVELLPFRTICQVKYDQMGIPFPFAHIPEPSGEQMAELRNLLNK